MIYEQTVEVIRGALDRRFAGGGNRIANPSEFETYKTLLFAGAAIAALSQEVGRSPPAKKGWLALWDQDVLGFATTTGEFVRGYYREVGLEFEKLERLFIGARSSPGQSGVLYEMLLGTDFHKKDGNFVASSAGASRAAQGAFFTPHELATESCLRVLNAYRSNSPHGLDANMCAELAVGDLSCGVGDFFHGYLSAIERLGFSDVDELKRAAVRRFFGIDVDFVALDVALCSVLARVGGVSEIERLASHWVQRNPLLASSLTTAPGNRVAAYAERRLYSSDLAGEVGSVIPPLDVVIGNPPWEKLRLEEREFFHAYAPDIAVDTNKSRRTAAIAALKHNLPRLYQHYVEVRSDIERARNALRGDPRFKTSARGESNTYALFAELAARAVRTSGIAGLLVKTSIATSSANKSFFNHLVDGKRLIALSDFSNARRIFPIDSRERFCLIVMGKNETSTFEYGGVFVEPVEMNRAGTHWRFPKAVLKDINPETGLLPRCSSRAELEFLLDAHERNRVFAVAFPDAKFGRLVHYTNHASHLFRSPSRNRLPVYEGKFFEQYDGRFATYADVPDSKRYVSKASARLINPEEKQAGCVPEARFFVDTRLWAQLTKEYRQPYSLVWRALTSPTNRRTAVATILPHVPGSQSVQLVQIPDPSRLAWALAIFNSMVFDFVLRRKIGGIDLTPTIVRQMPVPPFESAAEALRREVLGCVAGLLYDDLRLRKFCGHLPRAHGLHSRVHLRATIDGLVARAYKMTRREVELVLAELAPAEDDPGEYKREVLAAFNSSCALGSEQTK